MLSLILDRKERLTDDSNPRGGGSDSSVQPEDPTHLPPEIADAVQREATASERGWVPLMVLMP